MHRIEQYGFTLVPDSSVSEEFFLLTKRNIETVCHVAEQSAKQFSIRNANLAYRAGPNLFLTVNISDGKTTFGIFDMQKSTVSDTANISFFSNLTTQSFSKFGVRCFQTLQAISNGKTYNLGKLEEAWKDHLQMPEVSQAYTIIR